MTAVGGIAGDRLPGSRQPPPHRAARPATLASVARGQRPEIALFSARRFSRFAAVSPASRRAGETMRMETSARPPGGVG